MKTGRSILGLSFGSTVEIAISRHRGMLVGPSTRSIRRWVVYRFVEVEQAIASAAFGGSTLSVDSLGELTIALRFNPHAPI